MPKGVQNSGQSKTQQSVGQVDQGEKREQTRSGIAKYFVFGYFLIIAGSLVFVFSKKYSIQDVKDVLVALSALLGGPLSFILGYYFKETGDNK